MFDQGAPLISRALWSAARAANPWLPELTDLPPLSWQEALLIAQFEAARGCLGYPGESAPERLGATVLSVEPPLPLGELDRLFRFETWSRPVGTKLVLRPAAECEVFSVTVDETARRYPLFARAGAAFGLYLKPGFAAFPEPARPRLTVIGQ
jgi:hypothetical protein